VEKAIKVVMLSKIKNIIFNPENIYKGLYHIWGMNPLA